MNKPIDKKTLQKFLTTAGETLHGDWILIGGTVLPLLGIDSRPTVDIDLIALEKSGMEETLQLMEMAEKLGLAVESINQAGAYFLKKIPEYKKNLLLLHKGKTAKIFRPNLYLYINLKIGRLTESDLEDCINMIQYSIPLSSKEDLGLLKKLLTKEIKKSSDNSRTLKLRKLIDLLN